MSDEWWGLLDAACELTSDETRGVATDWLTGQSPLALAGGIICCDVRILFPKRAECDAGPARAHRQN